MADTTKPSGKKRAFSPGAWQEARALVYQHRGRLAVGLGLLLVNRLAGLVLPSSSKWVIDRVINQHHAELLVPLAVAAGAATLIQAITGFGLSQILGVAAQRAITDMRRTVQAYVLRLPISYFDSTKSGILISRIMTDAEGIRNLVGTGLVQLVGGLVTAAIALGVLFYLNWRLTVFAILILGLFGGGMAYAFTKLRPLFRDRGKINAEVTGRLGETLGGIRIVKAYRAERGERLVFTRGAHSLFRNVATTMTGISSLGAFASIIVGAIGMLMILEGGHAILAGTMSLGDFFMYGVFVGLVALPLINIASIGTQITEAFAGLDRIREIRRLATEDADDATRAPMPEVRGDVVFEDVSFAYVPRRHARRNRRGGPHRALRRVRAPFRPWLRHDRRGAGGEALGGRAPAGVDRARHPCRSPHPDSRRGHLQPRFGERSGDPGRPAHAAAGAHDPRPPPPPLDHPQRGSDPRPGGGGGP